MITFNTLEDQNLAELTTVFNLAFSDYMIKFQLSEQAMTLKLKSENISLAYSAGAFENGKLVGFILNGLDTIGGKQLVYNGGTGVVPDQRGQRLPQKMYEFISPLLKNAGYTHHLLEVIEGNEKAIRSYEKTGFQILRKCGCFKGIVTGEPAAGILVAPITDPDWTILESFRDIEPTWQNSTPTVCRAMEQYILAGAYIGSELTGYAVMDPVNGRIKQFAVQPEYRRKGVGTALFQYMNQKSQTGSINFINYNETDTGAWIFFEKLGLERFISIFEMGMTYA